MKYSIAIALFSFYCVPGDAQEVPVVSVSSGYIHLNADQHGASRADFDGWYVIPQYHFTKRWSLIAESTNFSGSPQGKSTNIHGYTAGPLYGVSIGKRVTPFVFAEIGDVRTSTPTGLSNDFAFVAGAGANIKLVKRVSLQIIPGDYILTAPEAGVLHHYAFQAGLAFDVWSK